MVILHEFSDQNFLNLGVTNIEAEDLVAGLSEHCLLLNKVDEVFGVSL